METRITRTVVHRATNLSSRFWNGALQETGWRPQAGQGRLLRNPLRGDRSDSGARRHTEPLPQEARRGESAAPGRWMALDAGGGHGATITPAAAAAAAKQKTVEQPKPTRTGTPQTGGTRAFATSSPRAGGTGGEIDGSPRTSTTKTMSPLWWRPRNQAGWLGYWQRHRQWRSRTFRFPETARKQLVRPSQGEILAGSLTRRTERGREQEQGGQEDQDMGKLAEEGGEEETRRKIERLRFPKGVPQRMRKASEGGVLIAAAALCRGRPRHRRNRESNRWVPWKEFLLAWRRTILSGRRRAWTAGGAWGRKSTRECWS